MCQRHSSRHKPRAAEGRCDTAAEGVGAGLVPSGGAGSLAGLAAAAAQAVEEDKKPKLLEAEPEGLVGEVAYEEGRYVRRDTRKGPSGE